MLKDQFIRVKLLIKWKLADIRDILTQVERRNKHISKGKGKYSYNRILTTVMTKESVLDVNDDIVRIVKNKKRRLELEAEQLRKGNVEDNGNLTRALNVISTYFALKNNKEEEEEGKNVALIKV